jgi:hypothetical protein
MWKLVSYSEGTAYIQNVKKQSAERGRNRRMTTITNEEAYSVYSWLVTDSRRLR